ncbi:hypothetical protein ASE03_12575 [Kitasatospora sp. Root187]|nr:hypothetical protein ASC99_20610 [Kitasatospora sp. Root107]KRB60438.1 hypothetical protein ASE03_12575 [Kitasatospora sp. Root187]
MNDGFCDESGNVVDTDAWDTRIVERDLAAWASFTTVLEHGAALLLHVSHVSATDRPDPRLAHSTRELTATYTSAHRRLRELIASSEDLSHPLVEEVAAEIWHEMDVWATHAPVLLDACRRTEHGRTAGARPRGGVRSRTVTETPASPAALPPSQAANSPRPNRR